MKNITAAAVTATLGGPSDLLIAPSLNTQHHDVTAQTVLEPLSAAADSSSTPKSSKKKLRKAKKKDRYLTVDLSKYIRKKKQRKLKLCLKLK